MHQSTKHFPTQEDLSSDAQPQVQLGGGGYKDHSSRSSGASQSPPVGELQGKALTQKMRQRVMEEDPQPWPPASTCTDANIQACEARMLAHARSLSLSMKSPKQEALMLGKDIHSKGLIANWERHDAPLAICYGCSGSAIHQMAWVPRHGESQVYLTVTGWSVGWKCFLINRDPIGSEKMAQGHWSVSKLEGPFLKKGIGEYQIFWLAGVVFKSRFLIQPADGFH